MYPRREVDKVEPCGKPLGASKRAKSQSNQGPVDKEMKTSIVEASEKVVLKAKLEKQLRESFSSGQPVG